MNPHQRRLHNDYKDLIALRDQSNGMFDFSVDTTYQHYDITIDGIETLVGTTESNSTKRSHHVFHIYLPPEYPVKPPDVKFDNTIFHPNWYPYGGVCYGYQWAPTDKLTEFIIDTVNMMMFRIVNTASPANKDANDWYLQNKNRIENIIPKIRFPPPSDDGLEFYDDGEDGLEFYGVD